MYSSQLSNFQILVVVMPSDIESDLAKSLSDLKEELRSGFSLLKSELVEDNSLPIMKLRSTALSTPKLKKKGIEKQFEANSQDLDHVQSASSFLAATPPQVEKALEELKQPFQNPYTGSWPISSVLACVGGPASRVESLVTFEVSAPSPWITSLQQISLTSVCDDLWALPIPTEQR